MSGACVRRCDTMCERKWYTRHTQGIPGRLRQTRRYSYKIKSSFCRKICPTPQQHTSTHYTVSTSSLPASDRSDKDAPPKVGLCVRALRKTRRGRSASSCVSAVRDHRRPRSPRSPNIFPPHFVFFVRGEHNIATDPSKPCNR